MNRFVPPSINELTEYFKTLQLNPSTKGEAESRKFHDYYYSNGWKVGGRSKMKDWQAAARSWARRDFSPTARNKKTFINKDSDFN